MTSKSRQAGQYLEQNLKSTIRPESGCCPSNDINLNRSGEGNRVAWAYTCACMPAHGRIHFPPFCSHKGNQCTDQKVKLDPTQYLFHGLSFSLFLASNEQSSFQTKYPAFHDSSPECLVYCGLYLFTSGA